MSKVAKVQGMGDIKSLSRMLSKLSYVTSKRDVRDYLEGVYVSSVFCKEKQQYITTLTATNTYALASYTAVCFNRSLAVGEDNDALYNPDFSFLIDRANIKKLKAFLPKGCSDEDQFFALDKKTKTLTIEVYHGDRFILDIDTFGCNRYPSTENLWGEPPTHSLLLDTHTFAQSINFIEKLDNKEAFRLRAVVDQGLLIMNSLRAENNATVSIPYESFQDNNMNAITERAVFGINPIAMGAALKLITVHELKLSFHVGMVKRDAATLYDLSQHNLKIMVLSPRVSPNEDGRS